MGATTQFSASESADALAFLGMAGLDTASMDATWCAGPAAASNGTAQTADIRHNILSGFGLEINQLGRLNDVLAGGPVSNTSVEQLGGVQYVGPVASAGCRWKRPPPWASLPTPVSRAAGRYRMRGALSHSEPTADVSPGWTLGVTIRRHGSMEPSLTSWRPQIRRRRRQRHADDFRVRPAPE